MLTADYRLVLYAIALLIGLAIFTKVRSRSVRQGVLLVGSYALYATWGLWFAAVLLASTVMNFLFGQALRRKQSAGVLWIGIICNLLLLGSFKYLPGFADSLPFASLQKFAHIALPLGISFWTFQAMSYLFDLYRGEELDPTLWEFALYMVFFPVAISGPICRMPDMLPQFRSEEPVQRSDMARGLCRIATGALMIQLGQLLGRGILNAGGINAGFDQVKQWSGPDVWCLAFGYGLQLFFDFGGYSHIAIGAAKMLGFTVPENFARPFASTTPSIFWTRWHMSLSFWIRDYVFLPLATLRREMLWRNLALVISMVLFGLWHKASLLFVLWGCYHGVLLVAASSGAAVAAAVELGTAGRALDGGFVDGHHHAGQLRLDLLPRQFPAPSQPDAQRAGVAVKLRHALSSRTAVPAGAGLGFGICGGAAGSRGTRSLFGESGRDGRDRKLITIIVRDRWVWLTPMYAFALVIVVWLVTRAQSAGASPFVYRSF